ncbi:hypothetical protein GNP89_18850 [Aliivibrio fischeri]|uniref:hypothetical protein n=1 Tax=Aliivibrio fischeri TaxID=668 RepID=UPI0012D9DD55|nr:hypothetical protein [Aliivibrio fischeri]MUL04224.1 hypothetical protein [Aliivibrio fischeri]
MNKFLLVSLLSCFSFNVLSEDWSLEKDIIDATEGYGLAQIYINKKSCLDDVILGLLVFKDVDVLSINNQNVRVQYFGRNNEGLPFYRASSSKGRLFIKNEFTQKLDVKVQVPGKSDLFTFSAKGYLEAKKEKVRTCIQNRNVLESAL